jgi:branched-chain amino acid transport system substrate-binding protein
MHLTTKTVLASALALAFAMVSIPTSYAEIGVGDKEIVIGTLGMLSGPSEFYGRQTNIGVDAYINTINDQGGIQGRKIKVLHEDDKYDADTAITCFNHLMSEGVFGIVGQVGSATLAKYIPMCTNNKVPCVGSYSGPTFACDPVKKYFFATRPPFREEVKHQVEHLWTEGGIRKIAVIYQNDAFGVDCLEGAREAVIAHGGELVATGSYTRNQNKIEDAMEMVKKANPEAVVLGAVYKPSADVLKAAKAQNWQPLFVMNTGSCIDKLMEEAGTLCDGYPMAEVAPPYTAMEIPAVATYVKALEKYFPKEKPNMVSLKGYIDAMVLVEGLKRTKDLNRENFVSALEKMKGVDFGLGKGMQLSYSPSDHMGFHKVVDFVTNNGHLTYLQSWKQTAKKHKS